MSKTAWNIKEKKLITCLTESMVNLGLLRLLYCCLSFVFLCSSWGFFCNWLIGRVLVLKGQSYYSSRSSPFTWDEISEAVIAISSLFSASVGCLLKVKWAQKSYLLFSFLFFFCLSQDFVLPFEAFGVYFLCVTCILSQSSSLFLSFF